MINIVEMQFVDIIRVYSDSVLMDIAKSKRHHILSNTAYLRQPPYGVIYLTNRIKDKDLKHKRRPILATIWNKINVR